MNTDHHTYNSRLDIDVEAIQPTVLVAHIQYGSSHYLADAEGNVYRALRSTVKCGKKYYNLSSKNKLRAVQADFIKSLINETR